MTRASIFMSTRHRTPAAQCAESSRTRAQSARSRSALRWFRVWVTLCGIASVPSRKRDGVALRQLVELHDQPLELDLDDVDLDEPCFGVGHSLDDLRVRQHEGTRRRLAASP
jgi:hypothetical protein